MDFCGYIGKSLTFLLKQELLLQEYDVPCGKLICKMIFLPIVGVNLGW